MARGAHRRWSNHRVRRPALALLLVAVLTLVVLAVSAGEPPREPPAAGATTAVPSDGAATDPSGDMSPYAGVGTWLSRYRITREFAGGAPPVTPADVDAIADAGVDTIYLQPTTVGTRGC